MVGARRIWVQSLKLKPAGNGSINETVLYSFTGGSDGENPVSTLIFDGVGNLYGTTEYGGPSELRNRIQKLLQVLAAHGVENSSF